MTQSPYQPPVISGGPPHYPQPVMPAAPKRRVHPLSIVLAAAGGVMFVIGVIAAAAGGAGDPAGGPSPSVVYVDRPAAGAGQAVPTTKPAAPAAVSVEDGTWTVGADVPAGKYRVTANVSSDCYWAILKSGTNGQDIIANGIPGGGRPTVTLKAGQDFESSDCGTWAKIG